ncbi:MAG: DUF6384 family protein [Desulfobacterales bacterium]|jgi:hypothetical protein
MGDGDQKEKTDLNDVMLAMDVVDTLRHEASVLDRELGREDRDRALAEKIKNIYASQGIDVSDAVVAEGVAALREERFVYRPPAPGFQHWLAKLYVRRGAWARGGLYAIIALVVGYAVYQFAVVGPQSRGRAKAVQALNLEVARQGDRIEVARNRSAALKRALEDAVGKASGQGGAAVNQLSGDASRRIASAAETMTSIEALAVEADFDADSLEKDGGAVRDRLARREELIQRVEGDLSAAEASITAIAELGVLPEKLAEERDSVIRESRTDAARQQAQAIHADAMAALNRGDVEGARQGSQRLQQLYGQVVQEYELRIVSRPGEPSGVWRIPEDKQGVRNFYLIVEAVTPGGKTLTVPVTSEEDGKTRNVQKWGMRVNADVFEGVRRDKEADGIVGNRRFGVKERGDLLPTYLMPTTGGAITEW